MAHRELWDAWQCQSPPPQGGGVRCRGTHGSTGALLSREARPKAIGHVIASETSWAGWWGLGPWDTWQRRSLPQQGGEGWSRRTRGCTEVHLDREGGFRAAGHVAAHRCTLYSLS
jgi:hypothetical protein